jgi:hypothetical protein
MIDTIRVIASNASAIGNESASEKKKKKNKITSSKLITPCNFAKDYAEGVRR